MTETTVVNVYRDEYDVYIGRAGKGQDGFWGNPFVTGKDGTRDEVIDKYAQWIVRRPDRLERIPELRGKRLGCFCTPKSCHGDILVQLTELEPEALEIMIRFAREHEVK